MNGIKSQSYYLFVILILFIAHEVEKSQNDEVKIQFFRKLQRFSVESNWMAINNAIEMFDYSKRARSPPKSTSC